MNVNDALLAVSGVLGGNSGGGGGGVILTPKTITENGIYLPQDDGADGYDTVTVDVPVGETVYRAPNSGVPYVKNEVIEFADGNGILYWQLSSLWRMGPRYANARNLESFKLSYPAEGKPAMDNNLQQLFYNCTALKTVEIDVSVDSFNGVRMFEGCTALESVTIGNIGKPFIGASVTSNHFTTCTALTDIILYVNASTLADVPENIRNNAPFGAANASVTYKNSTTGEVITA